MAPLRLCILCGNAAYNRGDRANLTAQIALLREVAPDAHITVCSDRAHVDSDWYDAEVVPRGFPCSLSLLRALRRADVVIWGGGALVADNAGMLLIPYWVLLIGFIKCILRKPVIAWAHGLVVETRMGAYFARRALGWADLVMVRDAGSMRTAQRLGITAIRTMDPAMLFRPDDAAVGATIMHAAGVPEGKRIIAIAPTFWQYYHQHNDLLLFAIARKLGLRGGRGTDAIEQLVEALTHTADTLLRADADAHVVLLPRYGTAPWPDLAYLRAIRTASQYPDRITVIASDPPPREYFAVLRHAQCLLSIAMHDAIVGAGIDLPTVQIVYEEKGADFAHAIGSSDLTLTLHEFLQPQGAERAATLVAQAKREWPHRIATHRERRARLEALARANARHAAAFWSTMAHR